MWMFRRKADQAAAKRRSSARRCGGGLENDEIWSDRQPRGARLAQRYRQRSRGGPESVAPVPHAEAVRARFFRVRLLPSFGPGRERLPVSQGPNIRSRRSIADARSPDSRRAENRRIRTIKKEYFAKPAWPHTSALSRSACSCLRSHEKMLPTPDIAKHAVNGLGIFARIIVRNRTPAM